MKFLIILFFFKMTAALAATPGPRPDCADAIDPHIREIVKTNGVLNTADMAVTFGLPAMENITAAAQGRLVDGVVEFKSDMGLSRWTVKEVEAWRGLYRHVRTRDTDVGDFEPAFDSHTELMNIAGLENYCTPGLNPEACEALRQSYRILRDAYRKAFSGPADLRLGPADDLSGRWNYFQSLKTQKRHIQFPWRVEAAHGSVDIPFQHDAQEVMRGLARENLIRHLVLKTASGETILGSDLDFETRMVVAEAPFLLPVLPILRRYPLTFPHDFEFGGRNPSELPLFEFRVPTMLNVVPHIHVNSNGESLRTELMLSAEDDARLSDQARLVLQKGTHDWLETLAHEFVARYNLAPAQPLIFFNGDDMEITLDGIAPQYELLFYYFAREKSAERFADHSSK